MRETTAQETMHHLLSLKLHSSFLTFIPVNLDGSCRVRTIVSDEGAEICTDKSFLDVYTERDQYNHSETTKNMNVIQFATK